jgi:hypothetical protein
MNDLIEQTLELTFSSKRGMPAHYSSNNDRTQSFCIDFEPLTKEHDYKMAANSWYALEEFLNADQCKEKELTTSQISAITRCGEDIMISSFILTKLGGYSLLSELKEIVTKEVMDLFKEKIDSLETVLKDPQANKYFDHCSRYGFARGIM